MGEALSNAVAVTVPAVPAPILVTDTVSFKAAIDQVDSATAGAYVIRLANTIIESGTLDAINLQSGVTLTIDGAGYMLGGANQYRGLFAYAGAITIQNLSIDDMLAQGGAAGYGAAGGGAGLGGGLFVAGSNPGLASGASVVLSNVNFSHDQAVGGSGSTGLLGGGSPTSGGGGGGGLGGNGGDYNYSSGGGGGIGAAAGMAGIVPGTASGGSSSPSLFNGPGTPGGVNGGGGGGGDSGNYPSAGGGGGVGGASGTNTTLHLPENNSAGGAGGFGGGGGGGGGPSGVIGLGGDGGFGGGGGSSGGSGGFGGGGSDSVIFGRRAGGFGAGSGMTYRIGNNFSNPSDLRFAGGGGLGAGGAIFVQAGGSLTIQGGTVDGTGSATGGMAEALPGEVSPAALNGQGLGAAIFLQGNQPLDLAAAAGQATTIANVIADQTGSGGTGVDAGDGSLVVSGPGIVKLSAANTYAGGTMLDSGTLELTSPTAAGTGNLQFTAPGATLQLDPGAFVGGVFSNSVGGFIGDNIDLPGLRYSPTASTTLNYQGMLTVTSGGSQDQVKLLSQGNYSPNFRIVADATGGTLVEESHGPVIIGNPAYSSGILLFMSEDAYLGDAEFTVAVDGAQIGGVQTVRALHNVQTGLFDIAGPYGSGSHTVTVSFINDAYGGSASLDRNLYVAGIQTLDANGVPTAPDTLYDVQLYANSSLTFSVNTPVPTGATTIGSGPDSFTLNISEDAYLGDALFQITVDSVQVGPVQTATAAHGSGQTQAFTVQGNFGFGPHVVGVDFLNDLYNGSPSADRNLYIDGAQSGSQTYGGLVLYAGGTQYLTVQIQPPTSVTLGSGPDTIELNVSEDAYASDGQMDAQFTISVDGVQVGGVQTADAARSQGKTEAFLVQGMFGAGPHAVTVDFLNDAYGGSLSLDRNLYVDSIIAGGQLYGGITLQKGGPQSETVQTPADVTFGSGPSALNLYLSEDALAGVDAQFTLSLRGIQIGGVQTVTASHAAGADQLFTILGNFPPGQAQNVLVNFLNGGSGLNLYIDKLTEVVAPGVSTVGYAAGAELSYPGGAYAEFSAGAPSPIPLAVGSGPNSVTVDVSIAPAGASPPAYVPFIFLLDGVEIGGDELVSVTRGPNSTQAFSFQGNFGPGPHTVFISPQTGSGQTAFFLDAITYEGVTTQLNTQVQETGLFVPVQPPAGFQSGAPLMGPASGNALLNGTPNADVIIAQGGHNAIYGLGGNDTVTASTVGGDTINLGAAGDTTATQDELSISGDGNVVAVVNASVTLTGSATNTIANLGDGNNTVQLNGAGNVVKAGLGTNTLNLTGGQAQIAIGQDGGGTYNDTITLTGTGNQVSASSYQSKGYLYPGNITITGGTGSGNYFTGPGTITINTDGTANTIRVVGGTFDITPGSGSDTVSVNGGYPNQGSIGTIRLAGASNVVNASGSTATVLGGSGGGTFNLGASNDGGGSYTLTTGGTNNTVNLVARQSTIDPGSGSDTVSITGSGSQSVLFQGSGDMLFLHSTPAFGPSEGGVTATVNDQSSNLQVFIDPYLQSLTLAQFGAAGVLHLLNGAGGYTSAAAAAAAITPDTGGGSMLVLNTFNTPGVNYSSGAIHFAAGEHITVANFSIG